MNTEEYIQATGAGNDDTMQAPASPSRLARGWARLPRVVRLALIPAALGALLGVGYGLLSGSGSAPQTPAGVIRADGYTLTGAQDKTQMIRDGDFTGAGQMLEPYVTGMAAGVRGGRAEGVLQLTGSGKDAITAMLPLIVSAGGMGQGVTAHMDGSFLIIDGPVSSLGSSGTLG